jgi:pimeloyl-ACP methyl ester carboxylesterase
LAIEHAERVRSLVSIMSTTGSRRVGTPTLKAFGALLAKAPRGRDAYIERIVRTFKVIGSPAYPMDEPRFRELAGRLYDRSHNPKGVLRQMHAISASGDRTAALRKLRLPATVIHGTRDPLVRPSGGRATARAIPGARLRIVEGMGHDLPRNLWPTFTGEIADTASRAGWRAPAAQPA